MGWVGGEGMGWDDMGRDVMCAAGGGKTMRGVARWMRSRKGARTYTEQSTADPFQNDHVEHTYHHTRTHTRTSKWIQGATRPSRSSSKYEKSAKSSQTHQPVLPSFVPSFLPSLYTLDTHTFFIGRPASADTHHTHIHVPGTTSCTSCGTAKTAASTRAPQGTAGSSPAGSRR